MEYSAFYIVSAVCFHVYNLIDKSLTFHITENKNIQTTSAKE